MTTEAPALDGSALMAAINDVIRERVAQHATWGRQDHPDGTGPDLILTDLPHFQGHARADHLEAWAKARCQAAEGGDTYERILTEEWAEAITSDDPGRLRRELVQVAAVAVAWIEKLDRETRSLSG